MNEEASLLEAIFAHPMDDTPRLVYADWLDEQGTGSQTARAEFIRISISLNPHGIQALSISGGGLPDGTQEPLRRANDLLDAYGVEWARASGLPEPTHPDFTFTARGWQPPNSFPPPSGGFNLDDYDTPEWTWWRGFVGRLTCSRSFWRSYAAVVFRAQPVTDVRIHRMEPADGSQVFEHTGAGTTAPLTGKWFWANGNMYPHAPVVPRHALPSDVFACLGTVFNRLASTNEFDSHDRLACYQSRDFADPAACLAFVQRGRALAGRGPLPDGELWA